MCAAAFACAFQPFVRAGAHAERPVSPQVYDITNTPNSHANEAIKTLNRFTRDTFGVGGIFHGAVEVNGEEWSFGYCPYGTGVRVGVLLTQARLATSPRMRDGETVNAFTAPPNILHRLLSRAGVQLHAKGEPELHVQGVYSPRSDFHKPSAGALRLGRTECAALAQESLHSRSLRLPFRSFGAR